MSSYDKVLIIVPGPWLTYNMFVILISCPMVSLKYPFKGTVSKPESKYRWRIKVI